MFVRITGLAVALCCLLATNAYADRLGSPTDPKALELLEQANRHYRVQDFEKAVELYKEGALVEDAPVFLYNLGQCYRMLGKYEDAIWHYERFLDRRKPDEEVRTYVELFISDMRAELEQRAKSHEPTEPGPNGGPVNDDSDDDDDDDDDEPAVDFTTPAPWHADTVGWILTGTGAVAVVGGGLLLSSAAGLENDANDELNEQIRADLHSKASTRRLFGAIGTIAGAGLLVTGVVKLIIAPKGRAPADSEGLSFSAGSSWIGVSGTF